MADYIKIALLSNFTTQYLGRFLKDALNELSVEADIYNGPYNQYSQEVLKDKSGLYSFKPDLIILMLDGKLLYPAWYDFSFLSGDSEDLWSSFENTWQVLEQLIDTVIYNFKGIFIVNNFNIPYHTPLGILDNKKGPGLKALISSLNSRLENYSKKNNSLYVFDYRGFCSLSGNDIHDSKPYYMTESVLSIAATRMLAREYLRYILPFKCKNRKCLVLDLDNTLWGGIAGESGPEGILLDVKGPGKCYYDFQKELLNLYKRGILLAINSKNNQEDALEIIEQHPFMLLSKSCFASIQINWKDKVQNLRAISDELNIPPDSLVFFDDSPVERELIRSLLPQVEVVDVPADPSKYVWALNSIKSFEVLDITKEDILRNKMYCDNKKRMDIQKNFQTLEDYLAALGTCLTIDYANDFDKGRIAQLTQKTNQFNMTTKRYSLQDIEALMDCREYSIYTCSVSDKFGDNGLTGVCIIKKQALQAFIDTFLISCRIMGRNIEYAFLSAVLESLLDNSINTVLAEYEKTDKNIANNAFYSNAGFNKYSKEGNKELYILKNSRSIKTPYYIKVCCKYIKNKEK